MLTPQQYHVLREKGMERAFTGEYTDKTEHGKISHVANMAWFSHLSSQTGPWLRTYAKMGLSKPPKLQKQRLMVANKLQPTKPVAKQTPNNECPNPVLTCY